MHDDVWVTDYFTIHIIVIITISVFYDETEVHASIVGMESNTPEAEDDDDNDADKNEATERDVPLRFTACDAGYYRRCDMLPYCTVLVFAYLLGGE